MSFKKLVPPDFELEILPPSQDLITKHISLINTLDKQMQFQGLCGLRKLVLTDSPGNPLFSYKLTKIDIAQGIINSGIVPVLLKLLDRDGEKRLQVCLFIHIITL